MPSLSEKLLTGEITKADKTTLRKWFRAVEKLQKRIDAKTIECITDPPSHSRTE